MPIRFQVDTDFYDHPKVLGLSDAAVALWTRAGAYSAGKLLDGFVPASALGSLSKSPIEAAEELVEARLWKTAKDGYRFHQWAVRNLTKAEVEHDRLDARNRKRKERSRKASGSSSQVAAQNVTGGVTRDGQRDSRGTSRVSHSPSVSVSVSESESPTYVGGEIEEKVEVSNASDSEYRVEDETRSKPVNINARKLSRIYTSKVKASDPTRIAAVVANMQFGGFTDDQITAALGRLADRPELIVNIDVLRREIETDGKKPMPYGMTEKDGITYASDGRAIAGPGWNYS